MAWSSSARGLRLPPGKLPLAEIVPLLLTAMLASIPVALPATFTLAAALGARALAKLGVLPTRLSAVDEAGTTDVLVRRQDRHADPERADGDERSSDAGLR
jgi:magnesium-transporting ATPase (P-type)